MANDKNKMGDALHILGVEQLKDQLRLRLRTGQVSYVQGEPGTGKTQIIYQLAAEAGYEAQCFMVSECMPEDFGGIVVADVASSTAVRLMPDLVSRMWNVHNTTGKPVLAFFDEINNGSNLVFSACMKLLHEGEAGGYKVPPGTRFVGAGNPPETSSVAQELPAPLFNRMSTYTFGGATSTEMQYYMTHESWHPLVATFLHQHPEWMISKADFSEGKPNPTPRSWEAVSTSLKMLDEVYGAGKVPNVTRMVSVAADVGVGAAKAVEVYFKYADLLVSWADIKADPEGAPTKSADHFAASYMQVFSICTNIDTVEEGKIGFTYIKRLPREMVAVYFSTLLHREGGAKFVNIIPASEMAAITNVTGQASALKLNHNSGGGE